MSEQLANFFATHQAILRHTAQYFLPESVDPDSMLDRCYQTLLKQANLTHHPLHNRVFYQLIQQVFAEFNNDIVAQQVIILQHYQVLQKTLQNLPLHCQKVAIMLRLHGWQYADIIAEMQLSEHLLQKCVKRVLFCCADDLRLAIQAESNPQLERKSLYANQSLYAKPLKGRRQVAHHNALDWFAKLATAQPKTSDIEDFNQWAMKSRKHIIAYAQIGDIWADPSFVLLLQRAARQFVLPKQPLAFLYQH